MSTSESELHCTQLIALPSRHQPPSVKDLTEKIQKGTTEEKIEAVKTVIRLHLNGIVSLFTFDHQNCNTRL
jgi:hypothetical protein